MSKHKKPDPTELQAIDPTALANVTGGASGTDPAVTQALTGILDSLSSLANQKQSSGFGPTEMMMFMMMMGGGGGGQAAPAVAPATTIGGYAGYTVDGVYYPFK